jgi:hypothetical protein
MGSLTGPGEQQPAQLLFDLMICQSRRPFLGHDHQVKGGQSGLVAAKKLPEQALDPVALDRFSQAPGNHQPQPGMAFLAMAEPRRLGETGGPFGIGFKTGAEHRQLASGMRL